MRMKSMLVAGLVLASLAAAQKVKSKNEQEAVMAVLNAQTPDAKIAAVDNLLAKFKDTEFKAIALDQAAEAAQQKGDSAAALVYGNRALEADPKNFQAMLLVSGQLAQTTREFDLDKDEKLKRATKLANDAIATINAAAKPNPQLSDEQWANIKKDLIAQAHETLGVIQMVDKKYDAAANEFKMAVDGAATPEPATMVRLAAAYNGAKKYDDALAMCDKVLAMPGASDQVKKIAQGEKQRAEKGKSGQ
jgi:tetratricopeptide (TPR) repeat protein